MLVRAWQRMNDIDQTLLIMNMNQSTWLPVMCNIFDVFGLGM